MSNGRSFALGVLAVTSLLAGCATQSGTGSQASNRPRVERVGLSATQVNAGRIGHAFLVPRDQVTDVVVQVSGVPNEVTLPVHLYSYIHQGTCASLGATPVYALNRRVLTNGDKDGFLTVRNTLPASLDTLRAGAHALVVRSAPADGNMALFCGDLRAS